MSVYNPDKWLLLEITPDDDTDIYLKVFGTWGGGYLSGDSFRINSGIESITQDDEYYYFKGYSGSVYKCYKNSYGVTGAYNYGVVSNLEKQVGVRVVDESEVKGLCDEN